MQLRSVWGTLLVAVGSLATVPSCRPLGATSRASTVPAHAAEAEDRPPVLLISIDALHPNYILRADQYGLKIPGLRRLLKEGSHATAVRGVMPTATYPSHTTILTGVSPERHGIHANTTFDPTNGNQGGWYWYGEDVRVPTLMDAATDAGFVTAHFYWPVNVRARATYSVAQVWRADAPDDAKLTRALSTPGLLEEMEKVLGPFPLGHDWTVEADERRARFGAYLLATRKPRFMTIHFLALDREQHLKGPFEREDFDVLERLDVMVQQLREAAERVGQGRAVVCVVSDHGHRKIEHEVSLNAALRDLGLLTEDHRGRITSWRAAVWAFGGSAAIVLNDPKDKEAETKVEALLRKAAGDPAGGVGRVWRSAEVPSFSGFSGAAFVFEMKPGYTITSSAGAPPNRTTTPDNYRAAHGYLPDEPDMYASFLLAGPGVPAGKSFGLIDMRDVAPTLAHVLGVRLPAAEGRDLLASRP